MQNTDAVLDELKRRGHRMTPQRRAIVAEIMAMAGHISPQDIVQRLEDRLPGVNDSTVYRTLDLLEEIGVLSHTHFGTSSGYHHAERLDHTHLVCNRCGRTRQIHIEALASVRDELEEKTGFLADFTHQAISGLCSNCREQLRPSD
jgi:Fur family ferric uptake transcriptional regulator